MSVDSSVVLVAGPWEHRYVAANGARFHVASAGEGPLVLFLHAFPQFWWTWRRQLTALAEAGYRAVAMDLRGYGASDKPPTGYDAPTLTADVAGVIRSPVSYTHLDVYKRQTQSRRVSWRILKIACGRCGRICC